MACRCRDMSKCLRDISKIEEIKGLVKNIEFTNISVSAELQSLAVNCISTFYCINMAELNHEEKRLNEDLIELLPQLISRCENKIDKLHLEYNSMRREDRRYHERRRHK